MENGIHLESFYPDYLKVEQVEQNESQIRIQLRSITQTSHCPVCGKESAKQYSFYYRQKVNDLPILGKPVVLDIAARMYLCTNEECEVTIFNEYLKDFLGIRGQWTQRCEAFIMALALNTSCEATAAICAKIGIKISGDTVIRLLLRNMREVPYSGESIGIDDWAYKKGQSYGTLICDAQTGRPIALLPGRDGNALRTWLANNKQIKFVTRDRANAFSKAIEDVLPQAQQIADRFHLFQNLLLAVKEAVKTVVPERVTVQTEAGGQEAEEDDKKNPTPRIWFLNKR